MYNYDNIFLIFLVTVVFIPILITYKKQIISWKVLIYFFFSIYVSYMGLIIFLPLPVQNGAIEDFRHMMLKNNYVPFKNISFIILNRPFAVVLKQILGNILMFVPFGFFLPVLFKKNTFLKYFLLCLIIASSLEITQLIISFLIGVRYKITDIDDVILNLFGGIIGYYIFNPTWRLIERITKIKIID